jgi:zinc D-Ala-D-Ala carboxypeptidase
MEDSFMQKLVAVREAFGALPVSSAYRCPRYNRSIGGGPAHELGRATDHPLTLTQAWRLVRIAPGLGMFGVGVKQHGPHSKRFIHLDDLEPSEIDGVIRPTIWSYN